MKKKVKNVWKQLKLLENGKQNNVETVKHGKKNIEKCDLKEEYWKLFLSGD